MSARDFRLTFGRFSKAEALVNVTADQLPFAVFKAARGPLEFQAPTEAIAYRIEQRVPVPGKPGEFQWEEYKP